MLEEFIRRFNDSFYADFARARLLELKKAQVANIAHPPIQAPVPSAPAARAADNDPLGAVGAFYGALSRADGGSAVAHVVPQKRGKDPYNENTMTAFFASLREPLRVLHIEQTKNDAVTVKYRYTRPNGTVCNGTADVTTTVLDGKALIQKISANC